MADKRIRESIKNNYSLLSKSDLIIELSEKYSISLEEARNSIKEYESIKNLDIGEKSPTIGYYNEGGFTVLPKDEY